MTEKELTDLLHKLDLESKGKFKQLNEKYVALI